MNKLEVLLHPVRMRIIQCLIGGKTMSAQQIYDKISDIPRTTVYRQVQVLYEEGILIVVDEQKVRGTVERFYQLAQDGESISIEEIQRLTKEEHKQLFFIFLMSLYNEFDQYVEKSSLDFIADGVGYRVALLQLSDEEFLQMTSELNEVLMKYLNLSSSQDRKQRMLATITIPKNKENDR